MKSYLAFTKKELLEANRTYKLPIMAVVFLILGMMNPITAKITPQLLKDFMPEGIKISISEPTALDSWAQFFKNVPQMGLIVLVIMFSGIMAAEFSRGTLIIILTKGIARRTVILSKFTMAVALWTLDLAICFGVSYAYTVYFWNGSGIADIAFAVLCLWLFGVLLISAVVLGGVLFRNSYGSMLFVLALVVVMFIINLIPRLQKYNPISLAAKNMDLITNKLAVSDFTIPIVICGAVIVGFVLTAIRVFNKKQV
jgi:ABC-2 type transport system permease protein